MDPGFMDTLEKMREEAGFPFIVTSAYRCPEYNAKVSPTGRTGPHTVGKAIDLHTYGAQTHTLIGLAITHGMTGIGIKQKGPQKERFIHLDRCQEPEFPRPRVWSY